jgi:mannose-6-phosphate isomerase
VTADPRTDLPVSALGARRLANLLSAPVPGDGPIGEARLLSDRDGHPSLVANGPLKGLTIGQLLEQSPP